jgi:hypothetical protein
MKTTSIILAFLLTALTARSQDSLRRYEFGSTLVSGTSFSNRYSWMPDRPPYHVLDGIFFRYTKGRLAFRLLAGYTERRTDFTAPAEVKDAMSGTVNNKEFAFGAGSQWTLMRTKKWLYAYADIFYRNVFATGVRSGGITGDVVMVSRSINSIAPDFGIGFRLAIVKNLILSPEIGYDVGYSMISQNATSINTGLHTHSDLQNFDLSGMVRVHLTARF